jgi:hypothetical protein
MKNTEIIKNERIEDKIVELRGTNVILDMDVASIYGVETRVVNQAVKNNPEKFPEGYVFELTDNELGLLRSKFLTAKLNTKARYNPKAFTEKGLYMLATILKSKRATEKTIEIIETFAKLRELSRTVNELAKTSNQEEQKSLMKKSGGIIADIIGDNLETSETESEFELNLALFKLRHKIKRK